MCVCSVVENPTPLSARSFSQRGGVGLEKAVRSAPSSRAVTQPQEEAAVQFEVNPFLSGRQ